jgi:transcriptional regulator with XRE-family HTH domain
MTGRELKKYRKNYGLTQNEASQRLGVSQTYLSLLESGERSLTEELKTKAVRVFDLRLTEIPAKMSSYQVRSASDDQLTSDLAALGYEGFSHWKPSRLKNPADVLLSTLNSPKRDARLIEALPWVVIKFPDIEWKNLVMVAKAYGLQNRLGFVTSLARSVAELRGDLKTATKLKQQEKELKHFKLERQDTLCNETMTDSERNWLYAQRSDEAKQWNLLTGLLPQHLRYYGD